MKTREIKHFICVLLSVAIFAACSTVHYSDVKTSDDALTGNWGRNCEWCGRHVGQGFTVRRTEDLNWDCKEPNGLGVVAEDLLLVGTLFLAAPILDKTDCTSRRASNVRWQVINSNDSVVFQSGNRAEVEAWLNQQQVPGMIVSEDGHVFDSLRCLNSYEASKGIKEQRYRNIQGE
jgi:hypothetical protein